MKCGALPKANHEHLAAHVHPHARRERVMKVEKVLRRTAEKRRGEEEGGNHMEISALLPLP